MRTYVKVIPIGKEQFDEQIILNFDGTVDMKQLPDTEVAEQENDTSVKDIPRSLIALIWENQIKNITEQVDKAKKQKAGQWMKVMEPCISFYG